MVYWPLTWLSPHFQNCCSSSQNIECLRKVCLLFDQLLSKKKLIKAIQNYYHDICRYYWVTEWNKHHTREGIHEAIWYCHTCESNNLSITMDIHSYVQLAQYLTLLIINTKKQKQKNLLSFDDLVFSISWFSPNTNHIGISKVLKDLCFILLCNWYQRRNNYMGTHNGFPTSQLIFADVISILLLHAQKHE